METRSNNVLVGTVVLSLLFALAGFFIWLANDGGGTKREYDIFFSQSVDGLNRGSAVLFSGVAAGQVREVALWPDDPQFVRVRIEVYENVPVLMGTTASLSGVGFTGVTQIALSGAVKGAPDIDDKGPAGRPVIPTRAGGLGELLSTAPQLLQRLTTLTERLTELASDRNIASIGNILDNVETASGTMARSGPEVIAAITETRIALEKAGMAAEQIGALAGNAQTLMTNRVDPALADLRTTLASANKSMDTLDKTLAAAQPGMQRFNDQSIPEFNALMRDLRRTSGIIANMTEKVETEGAGVLMGGSDLPDYKP